MAFWPVNGYTTRVSMSRTRRPSLNNPRDIRIVFITAPTRAHALRIARALVSQRLAACVNCVSGIRSIFRWQGRVDTCAETLLIAKTTARRLPSLTAAVRRLHPYELPEILALPAVGGSPAYLRWVAQSCSFQAQK